MDQVPEWGMQYLHRLDLAARDQVVLGMNWGNLGVQHYVDSCRPFGALDRTDRSWRRGRRWVTAVVSLALSASPDLLAQTIHGVAMSDSGLGIEAVDVVLIDAGDSVTAWCTSDSLGRFLVVAPQPGSYRLRAVRLGYATFTTDAFWVEAGQEMEAELRLAVLPVDVAPLSVAVEARSLHLDAVGFYHRMERGFGHFVTADQIQARSPERVSDIMRGMPGVNVVRAPGGDFEVVVRDGRTKLLRGRGACLPSVSIDGLVIRVGGKPQRGLDGLVDPTMVGSWTRLVHPAEIEGVEVYTGAAGLPVQVGGYISPCGAILIWTKR